MKPDKLLKRKAIGFILQPDQSGKLRLLVCSNVPGAQLRLPGGNVDQDETVEETLHREILEESGLSNLILVRKLGVKQYYKEYNDSNVERHDFLLMSNKTLPKEWEYIGTGNGEDRGSIFKYQWINKEEINLIDEEFRRDITRDYISELFSS